jgi:hypothetical protein
MSVERKRACGYRKVGGLYLVSGPGQPCGRLPIVLKACPVCSAGFHQHRGFQWVKPAELFQNAPLCTFQAFMCGGCPAAHPQEMGERAGLLWIGEKFYPTPEHFSIEASHMGVSRRIAAVPRGFKIGETFVLLAHPRVVELDDGPVGGIFHIMRPERIEKIVTASEARDQEAMAALEEKGITAFVVPDDDSDHRGSVYDDDVTAEDAHEGRAS